MVGKYDIEYNGVTGEHFDVFLKEYPTFSGAQKTYTTVSVAGKLGSLVGKDEGKSNLMIECVFTVISDKFSLKISSLKQWLCGTGNLTLSDSADRFFKVWKIEHGDIERELRNYGTFSVVFVCTPYEYLKDGQEPKTINEAYYNPYSESRPIYKIKGEGVCVIEINNNIMTANIGQNLTIDTDKMIAYKEDGVMQNTAVTGNYEDLYLKHGENQMFFTGGFLIEIIPNWGYEV